jgi:hypothetical protein
LSTNTRHSNRSQHVTTEAESIVSTRSTMGAIKTMQTDPIATNRSAPDPLKFSGANGTWDARAQKVELKLRCTTFQSTGDGLVNVQSFLVGEADQLVNNRVPSTYGGQKSNMFTSIIEMVLYLKEHYIDRNKANNAFSQLQKLT